MKTLHFLIGPKGAGKTYVGKVIEKHIGIRFLQVEPIWLSLQSGEDGRAKVEKEIDQIFRHESDLIIESLGVGENFESMRDSLVGKYRIRYIKVFADQKECLKRVRLRDDGDHIEVSVDKVKEYNKLAIQVEHPWDTEIDNNGPATDESITQLFLNTKEPNQSVDLMSARYRSQPRLTPDVRSIQ